jgi:hypothetical protein
MKRLNDSGNHHTGANSTETDSRWHQRLPFVATCPRCTQQQPQSGFTHAALTRLLNGRFPIEAYCLMCDHFWMISAPEREALLKRLVSVCE